MGLCTKQHIGMYCPHITVFQMDLFKKITFAFDELVEQC